MKRFDIVSQFIMKCYSEVNTTFSSGPPADQTIMMSLSLVGKLGINLFADMIATVHNLYTFGLQTDPISVIITQICRFYKHCNTITKILTIRASFSDTFFLQRGRLLTSIWQRHGDHVTGACFVPRVP